MIIINITLTILVAVAEQWQDISCNITYYVFIIVKIFIKSKNNKDCFKVQS